VSGIVRKLKRVNGHKFSAAIDPQTFDVRCPNCRAALVMSKDTFRTKVRNVLDDLRTAQRLLSAVHSGSVDDQTRAEVKAWLDAATEHREAMRGAG
jgi:hypothetical protein